MARNVPQIMNHDEVRQIVQAKNTIRESNDQKIRRSMVSSAIDFRVILHKVMSFHYAPTCGIAGGWFFELIVRSTGSRGIRPPEQGSIFAHRVDLRKRSVKCQRYHPEGILPAPGLVKTKLLERILYDRLTSWVRTLLQGLSSIP